jgi:hypothetical protein
MLLVPVGLNRVMSDTKIQGRLVELSAGERLFRARHFTRGITGSGSLIRPSQALLPRTGNCSYRYETTPSFTHAAELQGRMPTENPSQSTVGKIAAAWRPILVFFAQGFEHSIVNMFVIPTGMMLGAKVTLYDWWVWNQIPVTLGNAVRGLVFTGLARYLTHTPAPSAKSRVPAAASITTT